MTNSQWFARAVKHLEIVAGLEGGTIDQSDFWNKAMTVDQAIEVEKRNVAFCLGRVN